MYTPYKNRPIQKNKVVRVYRNLGKGNPYTYSIRQKQLVIGHADFLHMQSCKFIVSESGRQRALKEKHKNVHGYIEGVLCHVDLESDSFDYIGQNTLITYNPYKKDQFYYVFNPNRTLIWSDEVFLSKKGVYAINGRM